MEMKPRVERVLKVMEMKPVLRVKGVQKVKEIMMRVSAAVRLKPTLRKH